MSARGEHVNVHGLHIDWNMRHRLHRIRVEENVMLLADRADLGDRLDRADLVVRKHDRNKAGVLADRVLELVQSNKTVLMHVQQRDLEALLLQALQRV